MSPPLLAFREAVLIASEERSAKRERFFDFKQLFIEKLVEQNVEF